MFEGRPVIRPEELEDADTEESSILEHRDYSRSIQASRDNIKIYMNNIAFFHMMNVILDRSLPGEEAKKKVIEYAREHAVDKTVIMTVAGAANCRIDYNALSGKGDFDMLYLI